MRAPPGKGPGFWRTLFLLLRTAHLRARGRRRRQRQLFRARARGNEGDLSGFGFALTVALMAAVHLVAAWILCSALVAAERLEAGRAGLAMVSAPFLREVRESRFDPPAPGASPQDVERAFPRGLAAEARRIAQETGGGADAIRRDLARSVAQSGSRGLILSPTPSTVLRTLQAGHRLSALVGALVLIVWSLMLVFQGEGLELDIQRRRNPMWEWLFSHPVPPGAVFLAELLAPLAANPLYYSAPLFPAVLYGLVYGPAGGLAALFLVGVPVVVAAACLGKALETAVMLRCAPRSRGAVLGMMSWLGTAGYIMVFPTLDGGIDRLLTAASAPLWRLATLPWPFLGLFLGRLPDGTWSVTRGVLTCGAGAALTVAGSVAFSVWGARRGLAGAGGEARQAGAAGRRGGAGFGRWALYRKELLWLLRDRGAIVQVVLIPLTVGGFQLFQLGRIAAHASAGWNYACGAGLLFGTFFLSYLGPRSLASEGGALWIALTWPQGIEALLKAKAWLWAVLASAVVGVVFAITACLHPADAWRIALLVPLWIVFARSLARKTGTLATIASESGEVERVPAARRWATQLGTLTFALGVISGQWNLAVVGVVYSVLTEAAMWQGFRARLPFLHDRWSEHLPAPPTLVQAMVAIALLVELGTACGLIFSLFGGRAFGAVFFAFGYAAAAAAVAVGTAVFLKDRGAALGGILVWPRAEGRPSPLVPALATGIALGVALGGAALLYLAALRQIPGLGEMATGAERRMASVPHLREAYAFMAVLVAPFAEEFLFRGLLYRSLDREWGGVRAILGSAAFFAIYHPVLSWVPVGALGALNAWLFRRTGHLAPAVALHMAYNAVVVGAAWL